MNVDEILDVTLVQEDGENETDVEAESVGGPEEGEAETVAEPERVRIGVADGQLVPDEHADNDAVAVALDVAVLLADDVEVEDDVSEAVDVAVADDETEIDKETENVEHAVRLGSIDPVAVAVGVADDVAVAVVVADNEGDGVVLKVAVNVLDTDDVTHWLTVSVRVTDRLLLTVPETVELDVWERRIDANAVAVASFDRALPVGEFEAADADAGSVIVFVESPEAVPVAVDDALVVWDPDADLRVEDETVAVDEVVRVLAAVAVLDMLGATDRDGNVEDDTVDVDAVAVPDSVDVTEFDRDPEFLAENDPVELLVGELDVVPVAERIAERDTVDEGEEVEVMAELPLTDTDVDTVADIELV